MRSRRNWLSVSHSDKTHAHQTRGPGFRPHHWEKQAESQETASTAYLYCFLLSTFRPSFSYKDKTFPGFTVLKEAQVRDKKRERQVLQKPRHSLKIVRFGNIPKESVLRLRGHKGVFTLWLWNSSLWKLFDKTERLRLPTYPLQHCLFWSKQYCVKN